METASTPTSAASEQGKSKGELAASQRTCKVCIENNFGAAVRNVSLRHRMHNEETGEEYVTAKGLQNNSRSNEVTIHYMTGIGSGFDYWYVRFEDQNGQAYQCKDSFYCNLTSADEGNVVVAALSSAELKLAIPSGNCSVSLSKA
ncbi:MAG: hypothetical protein EOO63_16840 [Hymenobacter sp.]|nr:MAG: hypothetical protein EOO63_16840 [Hymenobacter sp.]